MLVDPGDHPALQNALEEAAALPSPNPAARMAAAMHDVRIEAATMIEALQAATR